MTIAEESTAWPGVTGPTSDGGLGFGFKWNMGWMHDSLGYASKDPIYRSHHHGQMTFSLVYAFTENYVLPISHDEVVHGKGSLLRKMPGDRWQQLANLRAYLAFMWAHPGKQLLFMGAEFGQESEWAESRELDWWLLEHPEHSGVHAMVRDMNAAYVASGALWGRDNSPEGFEWLDANDANRNVFSFVRRSPGGARTSCAWPTSRPCRTRATGCPDGHRPWDGVLNTDATAYTGSGVGNLGAVQAIEGGHGHHRRTPTSWCRRWRPCGSATRSKGRRAAIDQRLRREPGWGPARDAVVSGGPHMTWIILIMPMKECGMPILGSGMKHSATY